MILVHFLPSISVELPLSREFGNAKNLTHFSDVTFVGTISGQTRVVTLIPGSLIVFFVSPIGSILLSFIIIIPTSVIDSKSNKFFVTVDIDIVHGLAWT